MNPLIAYGLVHLVSQVFEILSRSSNNRFVAAREINALGVPPKETDLIMRIAAPRYSEHESAAMADLLQLTGKLLMRDGRVLADAYLDSVKSALTNGFLTLIPSIVVALPSSLSAQYYTKTTNQKVALASDVATAFAGRWDSFSQGGKIKLLSLLGQPASLATKPATSAGTGSSSTGAGSGSPSGSTSSGSSGGGASGGSASAPGGAKPANPSINSTQGSKNNDLPPKAGDVWDPEAGAWMSSAEYQSWKQAGWFLDEKGDWQQAVAGSVYDPAIDGYWSPDQMAAFQESGWSMSTDGLWVYSETAGLGIIDPDTGDVMSRQEYADWKELGWTIVTNPVDGSQSWEYSEPLDSDSVYDPDTGKVLSRDEYDEWVAAGWSIAEDGTHWVFDASNADYVIDPDTGQSMSAEEYASWNEQGWFIDPQGSWFEIPDDDGPEYEDYPVDDAWQWDPDTFEPDYAYLFNEGEPTAAKQTFGGAQLPIELAPVFTPVNQSTLTVDDLPDSPPPFDGEVVAVTLPPSEIDEPETRPFMASSEPSITSEEIVTLTTKAEALPLEQLNNALMFISQSAAPSSGASTSREAIGLIREAFGRDRLGFASLIQSLIDAPKTDWEAIEAANERARVAAREKEEYEEQMANIGWNIDDAGSWTWDQSVEDARIAAIYESVGLVQNPDGSWGFKDSRPRSHGHRVEKPVAQESVRHDARCLCDACVGRIDDGQFDIPSSLPLGPFHRSSWLNCSLADWAPGDYGEVVIDFTKTPFEVTLNRNVAPARREASLIHEALHVADEWYKTNMSHDNLHAISTFISKEIFPAVEALRSVEARD